VLEHPLADPAKGTGIAMVCTFGDTTDVVWWRELRLPLRVILERDGRFQAEVPEWLADQQAWGALAGKSATQARRAVVEELARAGAMVGEPRQLVHDVKFYEKGDRPLEIVTSRQWYISNGSRDAERREALLCAGRELNWTPDFMRVRYEHWVQGLNTDWLVSRQRYFGVPFPVWYPVDASGQTRWEETIVAEERALPVDPQSEVPPGYQAEQRGRPGGFVGDPDIMDTWATSSLTPQIVSGWEDDPELFARTFPMHLRPQGPEIIRTWLFSTLLRSQLEHGVLPWANAEFNGWILDPDRKKMSKSKGNLVTPAGLIQAHGADAVRYWSCRAAPGVDTAVDEAQMKIGRRLAVKLLNASKFVLGLGSGTTGGLTDTIDVTEPLDRAMLGQLATVVDGATRAFEAYQYQQALERTETFFWQFCDDYVELVKSRAYGDGWSASSARSARAALAVALSTLQRLLAPFLPFAAEEVWSWWQPGSVHRAAWPLTADLDTRAETPAEVFDAAAAVLREVRKAKTMAKKGMRTAVRRLEIDGNADYLAAVRAAADDLRAAGSVQELVLTESGDDRVLVELA
ncbi:MAG TPA: class I tRNA ligase family protein, partial [Nakamurella sp.]